MTFLGIQLNCRTALLGMTFFGSSTLNYWLRLTFFGFRLECLPRQTDLNQLMTQAVPISETCGLPGIDLESTHDSSGFPGIVSDWPIDSKCSAILRFKSTHDSSEKYLILSRLMIRLWVMFMSGQQWDDIGTYMRKRGSANRLEGFYQ